MDKRISILFVLTGIVAGIFQISDLFLFATFYGVICAIFVIFKVRTTEYYSDLDEALKPILDWGFVVGIVLSFLSSTVYLQRFEVIGSIPYVVALFCLVLGVIITMILAFMTTVIMFEQATIRLNV